MRDTSLETVATAILDHFACVRAAPIHEAAHAVVARALGLVAGSASVACDGDHYGYSETGRRLRFWNGFDARHARIIVAMAGEAAEHELLGTSCEGTASDDATVRRLLAADDAPNRTERHLRACARTLVCRHRRAIVQVAIALRTYGSLTGEEIDGIMSRYGGPRR